MRFPSLLKPNLTALTKLTVVGLAACAVAIWIQWLSGDPAYPKFLPGPVFFVVVAVIVALGSRWWWTPALGALVALLTTLGWFSRPPAELLRLSHPAQVGNFATGIFIGTLLQLIALRVTDVAGLAATAQNYRSTSHGEGGLVKTVCIVLGGFFVVMGLMTMVARAPINKYHNLLNLMWGAMAAAFGFAGPASLAKGFCIGSGIFYFSFGSLGMLLGDAAMNRSWQLGPMQLHTRDHIFHLALGAGLLIVGLFKGRHRAKAVNHET